MVMNHYDSAFNRHPNPARGCAESVNWNLKGAKCWLAVFTERHNRGVTDCFIACVDGLKGLPEAIEAVCPHTQVPWCIVHKVRNSLK